MMTHRTKTNIERRTSNAERHAPDVRRSSQVADRSAFTLIELLVVIGLVVILATILIVALAATTETAGAAKTRTLLNTLSQATSQFKRDHTVLPQVLDMNRAMTMNPPTNINDLQDWYSVTSPADYLLGYGGAGQDGKDGLGIRSPGVDGIWGATTDSDNSGFADLAERSPIVSGQGQVYGPYLELDDDELLAKINGVDPDGHPVLLFPSDGGYSTLNAPLVIVDYFKEPIHYYRQHPSAKRRDLSANQKFDLGDVFALRPFEIKSGSETQSSFADATGDVFTSFEMKSAEFAYFSAGPDKEDNHELRFDDPSDPQNAEGTEFVNEDNIVEAGS